jgi:hypothetical protein
MAKKKIDAGPATAAKQETPPAASAGDFDALMAKAGVTAAPVEEKSSAPDEISVSDDPALMTKINQYIEEAAKRKGAEGRMKSLDPDIRKPLIQRWLDRCRKAKSFILTLKINKVLNFGSPQLSIGEVNEKADPPLTKKMIRDGLKAHWGKDYDKYHVMVPSLFIKAEKLATPEEMMKTVKLLQDKLGADFAALFEHDSNIDFAKKKVGKDDIVVLKHDMALDPVVEAKVKEAIGKGWLKINSGSITPATTAIAAAEEKLMKEEIERQNKKNLTTAAAAGAAAGAALAAKAS